MRPILRTLRNAWLDLRTLRWLLRLRLELRRNGGRLRVEAWRGVRMAQRPRIRATPQGNGGGVTTIRLAPGVLIGYGVIVEVFARGNNLLRLDDEARIYEGVRLELRGGAIHLGENAWIHDHGVLKSDGDLVLRHHVRMSYGSCLHCSERIEIGEHTASAEYVTVTDSDHGTDGSDVPVHSQPLVTDPVLIEPNVWLARGAAVLRGVTIGRNSVVAANSVVRKGDYPARSLLAGAPAQQVRELSAKD